MDSSPAVVIPLRVHDGFDLRWPGAARRGSAGDPTCAARTCHFGDVSNCTVRMIESRGNVPSWGGGSTSLASTPPQQRKDHAFAGLENLNSPVTRAAPTVHLHECFVAV